MSDYVMKLQQAMKQQSQDLQDELSELKNWQSGIKDKSAAVTKKHENQKKSEIFNAAAGKNIPPIRYTAPAADDSSASNASSSNGGAGKKVQDMVTECKERGNAYFQRQQFEDAARAYTQGLDADPTSSLCPTLYGNRALCYLRLKNWDKAEKDATSAINLNRTHAKAFYRRALARKNLGNLQEAKSDLDTVQVLVPGDSDSAKELLVVNQMIVEQAKNENKTSAANGSGGQAASSNGKAASSAAPKKKKLVIQEVSDEDEGEEDGMSAEEQKKRDEKLRQEMKEAEARQDAERRQKAAQDEALRQRQRKTNSRVEIVDEDEDVEEKAPKVNIANTSNTKKQHQDPATTPAASSPSPSRAQTSSSSSSPQPTAAAAASSSKTQQQKPSASTSAGGTKSKSSSVAPRSVNVQVFTVDNMPNPESFSDFERIYREVEKTPDLVSALVQKLVTSRPEPALISGLFGANLTSEMFSSILRAAAESLASPKDIGVLLKALSQTRRIEDLVMFMEDNDQKYLKAAIAKSDLGAGDKSQVEKRLS